MKVSTFFLALAAIGLASTVVSLDAQVKMAQIQQAQQCGYARAPPGVGAGYYRAF